MSDGFDLNAPMEPAQEPESGETVPRSADSYSAKELAAMRPQDRVFIEATQLAAGFYRFLDAFSKAWGFSYDARFGMVQKLPHEDLTERDYESLSRGGRSISELKEIAAQARKENWK